MFHCLSENIRKNPTGQGDDYKFGSLLVHTCFKENYELIAIDLSKQKALDAHLKVIRQVDLTEYLDQAWKKTLFEGRRVLKEAEEYY